MRGIEVEFARRVPPLQGGGNFVGTRSRPFRPGCHITGFQPASQRCIVSRLDALSAKQTETEAKLAAFTPALLAKAFKGEL